MPFSKGNTLGKNGRPKAPHTVEKELNRSFLVKKVSAEKEAIIQAQIESAKGLYIEQVIDGIMTKVYRKSPDTKAGEYLLNQVIGKPTESIDIKGEITSKVVILDE